MRCPSILLALAMVMVAAPVAYACGPEFGPDYLAYRIGTLADLPEGVFADEVARLVPADGDFALTEEPPAETRRGGPEETALYRDGATAFHASDWDTARKRFEELLQLPAAQRRRLSVAATFTLGRMAGDAVAARTRFARVRELVRDGFADPLALAVASLGEEARTHLRAGNDLAALRLYAEQAAYGDTSGSTSLLYVVRDVVVDRQRLQRLLHDPLGQRLLAIYAWTRPRDRWDASNGTTVVAHRAPAMLLGELAKLPHLAGADLLAAAAWRAGRFDIAETFAAKQDSALAYWVRGKLAVRQGQRRVAEDWLQRAIDLVLANHERPMAFAERIASDHAVLALARGDIAAAMPRIYASCNSNDIAYVAESVLTVDELQAFLAHPPIPDLCATTDDVLTPLPVVLRNLLARRLMRSERFDEALPLFSKPDVALHAAEYVHARRRVFEVGSAVEKARSLFMAARLARRYGLEILGTEMAPDYFTWEGAFDPTSYRPQRLAGQFGFSPDWDWDDNGDGDTIWERYQKACEDFLASRARVVQMSPTETLRTPLEDERVRAHAPTHRQRFHYRQTAADLAEQAAALLPPRSQAYAMVLCHAARFVIHDDAERAGHLWQTYVKNGARIDGDDVVFGEQCREPDFDRAAGPHPGRWLASLSRRHPRSLSAAIAVAAITVVALVWRRRRRLLKDG